MRTPPHVNREPSPELARISPLVTRPPKPTKPPPPASTSAVTSTPNTSKHVLNILSNYQNDFATITPTTTITTTQQHNQYNYNKGNNNNNNNNNNDHFHDIYDLNNSKLFTLNDDNSSNSELYDRTNVSSPFKSNKMNSSFYDGQNSNKSNEYIPTSLPPTPTPQTSFFQQSSGTSNFGGGSDGVIETSFNKEPTPPPPPAPVTSIQPQGVLYAPQPHYQLASTQPTVTTLTAQNQSYLTMAINNRASSYIVSNFEVFALAVIIF